MKENKPWLNASGCPDPTAYQAIKNVEAVDRQAGKFIKVIFLIADLTGFEIIGRIQIKHRKSGRMYK